MPLRLMSCCLLAIYLCLAPLEALAQQPGDRASYDRARYAIFAATGMLVSDIDQVYHRRDEPHFRGRAAVVDQIAPGSPADFAQIPPGAVITSAAREFVSDVRSLRSIIDAAPGADIATFPVGYRLSAQLADSDLGGSRTLFAVKVSGSTDSGFAPRYLEKADRFESVLADIATQDRLDNARLNNLRALFGAAQAISSARPDQIGSAVAASMAALERVQGTQRQARLRLYASEGQLCTLPDGLVLCTRDDDTVTSYLGRRLFVSRNTVTYDCPRRCGAHSGWCNPQTGQTFANLEAAERSNCTAIGTEQAEQILSAPMAALPAEPRARAAPLPFYGAEICAHGRLIKPSHGDSLTCPSDRRLGYVPLPLSKAEPGSFVRFPRQWSGSYAPQSAPGCDQPAMNARVTILPGHNDIEGQLFLFDAQTLVFAADLHLREYIPRSRRYLAELRVEYNETGQNIVGVDGVQRARTGEEMTIELLAKGPCPAGTVTAVPTSDDPDTWLESVPATVDVKDVGTLPPLPPEPCESARIGESPFECSCLRAQTRGSVWGSNPYTADSSICTAATHAGLTGLGGAVVTVIPMPGQPSYSASSANGVTTQAWRSYPQSFTFEGTAAAQAPAPAHNAAPPCRGFPAGEARYACQCAATPAGGRVWGSGPYTADSNLCRAARHAGVLGAEAGLVTALGLPGLDRYRGSAANGITTDDWGSYGHSFVFDKN